MGFDQLGILLHCNKLTHQLPFKNLDQKGYGVMQTSANWLTVNHKFYDLVQSYRMPIDNTLNKLLFCTKPTIW